LIYRGAYAPLIFIPTPRTLAFFVGFCMIDGDMAKKSEDQKEKLRLRIKAYDAKLIDSSVKQIIEAIRTQGGEVVGPIPLPTEFKKYTVNRSTFVHKKSGEHFEIRVHKRLVDIMNPEQRIIESLSNLNLPAGVEVEMKMG